MTTRTREADALRAAMLESGHPCLRSAADSVRTTVTDRVVWRFPDCHATDGCLPWFWKALAVVSLAGTCETHWCGPGYFHPDCPDCQEHEARVTRRWGPR